MHSTTTTTSVMDGVGRGGLRGTQRALIAAIIITVHAIHPRQHMSGIADKVESDISLH